MLFSILIRLLSLLAGIYAHQQNDHLDYKGAYIGKFNSYAHQVSGEVYAVDQHTFLIKDFFYDGLATDAYFWVGATVLPSNVGFIVPNEKGRTNKLRQYINQNIRIRLPEDKSIHTIRWLAIWDIRTQKNFADLFIPEGFLPPAPQTIAEFSQLSNGVRSEPLIILNAKTIKIPSFSYDGLRKEVFFWVGSGPQPNSVGEKIPNELGYLEPLGPYKDDLVILELPGNMTIFDINYISVWDREQSENLGSVIIPDELNVPPALSKIIKVESRLPNCEQLHQRLQINWEIFGPQITFELIGQLKKDDYMAFGLSGSDNSSQMLGSDIALAYMETHLGFVRDYNITGIFPCINVLGNYQGVCPDEKVGGVDNFQVNLFERQDTLTRITYRRNLQNVGDDGDKIFEKSRKSFIVWAIGKLTNSKDPGFHHIYPKHDISLVFGRKPEKNCFYFTTSKIETIDAIQSGLQQSSIITKPWGPLRLLNRTMTTLYARLGDSGGLRGYYGSTGLASPNLVWYINGLLAPILYVKRGRTYTFRIEGGNNPSQAELYNPLYITNDPYGGFTELTDSERKKYQVYAGIEFDRRGRPNPTSAGRLCVWRIPNRNDSINDNINYFDKRRADTNRFQSFIQYRNRLHFHCDPSTSAQILQWTPNSSVPDIVYYQSYTHKNMGNRIIVVDDFTTSSYAGLSFTTSSSTNSIDQNPKSILYKQIAIAIVVILMITNVSSK